MKRVLAVLLAIVMMSSVFAGCGKTEENATNTGESTEAKTDDSVETPDSETKGVIKIAVAGPLTGDNAEYGKGFLNAVEMKVKEWNDKGGVLGKTIEVVPFDDKNSSEEAASIAQKIVSDDSIVGVIGHFSSGVCMTAAPIYDENKLVEISPSASHLDYSGIGEYIFRNNTVIKVEAGAALDIATNDLGKKNIGIISIKTDWGTNTAGILNELVAEKSADGVTIVAHEEVMEGSDDYGPAITKLEAAGAEVVICAGMYSMVAPVAKQYKQVNPDIEIVGFSNAYSQQLIELGGEAVEGVRFPVIFFSGSDDPEVKAYVDSYTETYGAPPSALTSQTYDSAGLLLTAIENAGSTDKVAIKDELYKIDYKGVTGDTKFDENGDVQKEFVKVKVENGQFVKA